MSTLLNGFVCLFVCCVFGGDNSDRFQNCCSELYCMINVMVKIRLLLSNRFDDVCEIDVAK